MRNWLEIEMTKPASTVFVHVIHRVCSRSIRMATSEKTCYRLACLASVVSIITFAVYKTPYTGEMARMSREEDLVYDKSNEGDTEMVEASWSAVRQKLLYKHGAHKSVFIFGYMRGGTTLLDHVIGQDKRAITWFEPLAPIYGHMYSLPKYRIHSSIVFDTKDSGKFRTIGKWEMEHLVDFFTNLFSCNLDKIPVDFLSCSFLIHTQAISDYVSCFKNQTTFYNKPAKRSKVFWESDCYDMTGISKFCEIHSQTRSLHVGNAIRRHCDVFMEYTRDLVKLKGSIAVTPEFLSQQIKEATGYTMTPSQATAFLKQQICMDRIGKIVRQCSQSTHLEQQCASKQIRAAKVLRIKMPNMEAIIQAVPDIYILHYVRDPRAMAKSRMTLSGNDAIQPDRWVDVTRQLCDEMLTDMLAATNLNRTYPDVIQRLRYEDLVLNPEDGLDRLYGSFGESYPPELHKWLKETMNANADGGTYSVKRSNASAHIEDWRKYLPAKYVDKANIYPGCKQVLKALGYTF